MPGRLIGFIVTLLIIVSFIGFNIENSSDIRIWFGDSGLLSDVPIFVSFFIMYLIGVMSVIPFLVGWKLKRRKNDKNASDEKDVKTEPVKKKNVRVLGSRKRSRKDSESDESEIAPIDRDADDSTENSEVVDRTKN